MGFSRSHVLSGDSEIMVLPCTHWEPLQCLNGRLNDEWDFPTATPGKYQAYRPSSSSSILFFPPSLTFLPSSSLEGKSQRPVMASSSLESSQGNTEATDRMCHS